MIDQRPGAAKTIQQNIHQYGNYYNKPSWWFKFRYDTQIKRKTCLHLIRKAGKSLAGQRIMEIGFGSGETLFSFAPDCAICGIELSDSAIANARRRAARLGYASANFQQANADGTLPFPAEEFDIVIASHVVEHVEDDAQLLSELRRILKRDGIAVILIPINEKYVDPNHIHRYSLENFETVIRQAGFTLTDSLQNELLFHLVERIYYEGYIERWRIAGPAITALFNLPFSILPFRVTTWIERLMAQSGYSPRQAGFVLTR